MDRYSDRFDHAYSDVSDELERAWTATETAAEAMTTAVVSAMTARLYPSYIVTPMRRLLEPRRHRG